MIISYRHRFIFLHCRKTAGSAISLYLAPFLGPRDIQLGALEETMRAGMRPPAAMILRGVLDSHFRREWRRRRDRRAALVAGIKGSYTGLLGDQPQHAHAADVRQAFPRAWADCYRFCVVRNPFARMVSDYHWRTRGMDNPPAFSQYLRLVEERLSGAGRSDRLLPKRPDNWPIYTIDHRVAVDRVIRYEQLAEGLGEVLTHLGIPWRGSLPQAKAGLNPARGADPHWYRTAYGPGDRERVERMFSRELETFGYSY